MVFLALLSSAPDPEMHGTAPRVSASEALLLQPYGSARQLGVTIRDMRAPSILFAGAAMLVASELTDLQAQTPMASLAGCITDTTGEPARGVKVLITAANVQRSVFSDAVGCYKVEDLPPSEYVVFATLPGFASVTRDQLRIAAGALQRVDFQMAVPPMCECITFSTLADFWKIAEAIVRVRIVGHDATSVYASGLHYPRHVGTVLTVVKQRPSNIAIGRELTFLQKETHITDVPFSVGQEFLLIVHWSPRRDAFQAVAGFVIEDGRIQIGPLGDYLGQDVRKFLGEAQALPD
jgi:hypothetical protein